MIFTVDMNKRYNKATKTYPFPVKKVVPELVTDSRYYDAFMVSERLKNTKDSLLFTSNL